MESPGPIGIRAIDDSGKVLEFSAGPHGEIVCSRDLSALQNNTFTSVALVAFYSKDADLPHLVFPCDASQSEITLNTGASKSYSLKIDLVCPLLHCDHRHFPPPGALAVGEYVFVIRGKLFAPSQGVSFYSDSSDPQSSRFQTVGSATRLDPPFFLPVPSFFFSSSDSLSLVQDSKALAIYGDDWAPSQDAFGYLFGLMSQIGKKHAGAISVITPAKFQSILPQGACVATALILDRTLKEDNGAKRLCPGYEISFTGSSQASYLMVLGDNRNLVVDGLKLPPAEQLFFRCSIDPNFYEHQVFAAASTAGQVALPDKVPWIIEIDGVDAPPVAAPIWNETIAKPYLQSIRMVDDGNDLSYMPLLVNPTQDAQSPWAPWNVIYRVQQDVGENGRLSPDYIPSYWDKPELLALVAREKKTPTFRAIADFPNLVAHNGKSVRIGVSVIARYGWDGNLGKNASVEYAIRLPLKVGFALEPGVGTTTDPQRVRMGSLDLDFTAPTSTDQAFPHLDMSISARFGDAITDPKPKGLGAPPLLAASIPFALPRVAIEAGKIPLGVLQVGGQDPVPDELLANDAADVQQIFMDGAGADDEKKIFDLLTRDPPLVFSPSTDDHLLPENVQPYLVVVESTSKQLSRRLTMRLRTVSVKPAAPPPANGGPPVNQAAAAAATTTVYVIDTDPLTVAEVSMPKLGAFADGDASATDGEIANWETTEIEGARWQLSSAAAGFELRFPPQATGEAMEKGLPWPAVGLTGRNDPTTSIAIDYRLGPPSRMKLQSAYFDQRYAEAPWNLRRVLGYPRQRDPGATVNWLRFELLYGLSGFTWADNMRVTELSARIGSLPTPLIVDPSYLTDGLSDQTDSDQKYLLSNYYNKYRLRSAQFFGRFRTRLGLYEYRQEGGTEPFSVSDKIEYLLRLPADWPTNPLTPAVLKKNGEADMKYPMSVDPAAPGLAGGALWGIESKNILDSITREPHAFAGLVSRLSASALGGSGAVKADFAKGKSSIKAEVSYGRIESYIVEQLGRIGVFWNVAKHVIVYQRTVLPSDQFCDAQPVQDGRPMPRKVAEYIELLQLRREYPENSKQATLTRGFVEAANFPAPRIPVDGGWGRDTPTGWAIPLWKSDADPHNYPRPIIMLELAAGADSAAPTIRARFKDPSQLTFYTSTLDSDGVDTDQWTPVVNIDFQNAPAPAPVGTPAIDPSAPDMQLPGDLVRDALYDCTTFDVDAGGLSADLAAGRTGGSRIGAVIETVTMMRAQPRRGGVVADVQNVVAIAPAFNQLVASRSRINNGLLALLNRARTVSQTLQDLPNNPQLTNARNQLKADVRNQIAQAKADLNQQINAAAVGAGKIVNTFQQADDIFAAKQAEASAAIGKVTTTAIAALKDASDQLTILWVTLPATSELAQTQLLSVFQNAASGLDGIMVPAVGDLINKLQQFKSSISEKITTSLSPIVAATSEFQQQCALVKDEIKNGSAGAANDLQNLLGRFVDLQGNINGVIDELRTFVGHFLPDALQSPASTIGFPKVMYGDPPQQFLNPTLKQVFTDLSAILVGSPPIPGGQPAFEAVGSNLEKALAELGTPPDVAVADMNAVIAATKDISSAIGDFEAKATAVADALPQFVASKTAVIWPSSAVIPLQGAGGKFIAALQAKVYPLPSDPLNAVGQELKRWTAGITTLAAQAQKTATDVVVLVDTLAKDLNDGADALSDAVSKQIADLQGGASKALDALADNAAEWIDAPLSGVADAGQKLAQQLQQSFPPGLNDLQRQLQAGYEQLKGSPTFQDPDSTLRLLRAAGAAPIVPNLSFNKDRLAYFFDDAKAAVQTSPAVALLNRVGDDLKAVGIRVPTGEILDRVIPASLQNFNLGSLFPDLAGLKLDSLFPGFHLPAIANNNVSVTHGFDQARLEAWAKADADVPFGEPARVFAIGPIEVTVVSGNLEASIDISIDASGQTTRKSSGQVSGDWQVGFGGSPLITFVDTLVKFDDQKGLTVNIQPDKVELEPALQFLTDILDEFSDPDSGFHLDSVLNDVTGAFEGIMATIDLPLPPLAAGAFAVSNLRFSTSFGLSTVDDFTIVVSTAIGRQTAPFSILVAFFTGGGWIEAQACYAPSKSKIVASVTIEIVAGVGVDFSFGPCRGYVYIMFGSSATYSTGGPGLSVSVILLIYGGVNILGLIDISLSLMLSITYNGYTVIGRGELDVSIKICWCVHINVHQGITYSLARNQPSSSGSAFISASSPDYLDQFS